MAIRFITYQDLVRKSELVAEQILAKGDAFLGVVGVPRSGMIPAAIIAQRLHLPLASMTTMGGPWMFRAGRRMDGLGNGDPKAPALLVDDSAYKGSALKVAIEAAQVCGNPVRSAVIYGHPCCEAEVDYVADCGSTDEERYMEWNIFHRQETQEFAMDLDGVLCEDPPVNEDDAKAYAEWIDRARPLVKPAWPVGWIVTNRLERHRHATERWLHLSGIRFRELVMSPFSTAADRRAGPVYGHAKGMAYKASAARLFIESSTEQAKVIAAVSGKPVLSWESKEMF